MPPRLHSRSISGSALLRRRIDLLLWRLFGQGARLGARNAARGWLGVGAAVLALLGLSAPR
jgi:hypothetical protein